MGQRKGTDFFSFCNLQLLNGTNKLQVLTCRKRKPRTNTTKHGKNGNKKTKKAAENTPVQSENVVVHAENTAVQPENATENTPVHAENVATAKANILSTSPERLTRRYYDSFMNPL